MLSNQTYETYRAQHAARLAHRARRRLLWTAGAMTLGGLAWLAALVVVVTLIATTVGR